MARESAIFSGIMNNPGINNYTGSIPDLGAGYAKKGFQLTPEMIQALLAFGAGTLANNTGNYGQFGPAVGKGGLMGLNAYNQATRTSFLKKQQEEEEKYREAMLGLRGEELGLKKNAYQLEQDKYKGAMGMLDQLGFGAPTGVQSPVPPNTQPGAGMPSLSPQEDQLRQKFAGLTPEQQQMFSPKLRNMLGQSYGGMLRQDPDILSTQQAHDLLINDQDPYAPRQQAQPPVPQPQAQPQSVMPEINQAMKYSRAAVPLTMLNKEAGAAVGSHADRLLKQQAFEQTQRDFARGKITFDPYGIGRHEDEDYEFVMVRDETGAIVPKPVTTEEAQVIRNKGRKAGAANTTIIEKSDEAYLKQRLKDKAETVKTYEVAAASAKKIKRSFAKFRELEKSKGGAFQGGLAPGLTGALNFLATFGVKISRDTLANSQAMQSINTKMLADWMADLGGARGLTETEAMLLAKALPNINQSIESRKQIMDILEAAADRVIAEYDSIKAQEEALYPDIPGLRIDTLPRVSGRPLITDDDIEKEIQRRGLK